MEFSREALCLEHSYPDGSMYDSVSPIGRIFALRPFLAVPAKGCHWVGLKSGPTNDPFTAIVLIQSALTNFDLRGVVLDPIESFPTLLLVGTFHLSESLSCFSMHPQGSTINLIVDTGIGKSSVGSVATFVLAEHFLKDSQEVIVECFWGHARQFYRCFIHLPFSPFLGLNTYRNSADSLPSDRCFR